MLKQLTEATKHVVGVKQTAKAVEKGTACKSNNRGFDARTWQSMRHSRWGCCRRGA